MKTSRGCKLVRKLIGRAWTKSLVCVCEKSVLVKIRHPWGSDLAYMLTDLDLLGIYTDLISYNQISLYFCLNDLYYHTPMMQCFRVLAHIPGERSDNTRLPLR